MDEMELADYAVEQASQLGADFCEARLEVSVGNQFVLKNGVPELGGFTRSRGIGVRVLVGGGMGFASTNSLTKRDVEGSVERAVAMARGSSRLRSYPIQFSEEEVYNTSYEVHAKEKPSSVDVDTKMGFLVEIDGMVKDLVSHRLLVLQDSETTKYLVTSEGCGISSSTPRVSMYYMITAVSPGNGGSEQAWWQYGTTGGYEHFKEWNIAGKIEEQAKKLVEILCDAVSPPRGVVDFVVGSEVAGIISHENCGHPSEADRILGREGAQAGESFLGPEKLGKKIGSEHVTIVDDPTIPGSYGYYLYDDEGVKARRRELIKKGVFNEMLHNRETAKLLGVNSNGAARGMGYNREPIVRMSNTFIAPGDYSEDEIFEDVKLGVYMLSFTEWNIDDRRYQSKYVGREAYLIKDGEVTSTLLRRPVLEITTPDLFNSIDACSKTLAFDAATCGKSDPLQGAPVWLGGPKAVRIRGVRTG